MLTADVVSAVVKVRSLKTHASSDATKRLLPPDIRQLLLVVVVFFFNNI